jgi:lysophospholipase L1-like esterase
MKKFLFIFTFIIVTSTMAQKKYLALGDSYTIGEGLEIEKSWPYQLVHLLKEEGFKFKDPKIIAKTGWRTDELKKAMRKGLEKDEKFDLVSLLIGVNNQYQEKSFRKYKREFKKLLKKSISKSKHDNKGVFVVSIPDYGVTEFAKEKNKTNAIQDLMVYNSYAKQLCDKYSIAFYDITELSSELGKSETMLNDDKLHPNDKHYKAWIDLFFPQLVKQLKTM